MEPTADCARFEWPRQAEATSKVQYKQHVASLFNKSDNEIWLDCSSYPQLLTVVSGGILDFTISGTSDVALCTESAVEGGVPSTALRILFKLEKPDTLRAKPQAALCQAATQLLLSNVHSPSRRPYVVVTDLVDMWTILWMNDSVMRAWRLGRGEAVAVIQRLLDEELVPGCGGTEWPKEWGGREGAFFSLGRRSAFESASPVAALVGEDSLACRLGALNTGSSALDEESRKAIAMEAVKEVAAMPCFAAYADSNDGKGWLEMYT